VRLTSESIEILTGDGDASFTFDKVFGPSSTQQEVFDYVAEPVVGDVMNGYNATVFAYGQTGSGKTFTMEGASIHDDQLRGVIPRTASALFEAIAAADESIEFVVKVSYVEIYCEKIRDLLDEYRSKVNLPIREDKQRGIYISGVTEQYITGPEELLSTMASGASNRAVAATGMNSGSSRSHSVFTVEITSTNTESNSTKTGKMVLVDLAGSEMVRKTNATGTQLEEAKNINKSLSALGQVINALTDGRSTHVPFRDSKLTRLLQNSLGGNSKTNLIINVSPSTYNADETISTCRFGSRAKRMRNKAVVNETRSAAELEVLVKKLEAQLLRRDERIAALEGGDVSGPFESSDKLSELQSSQEELEEERAEVARLREENEKLRDTLGDKERMLAEASELLKEAERHCSDEKETVETLQLQLGDQASEFEERHNLLKEQFDKTVFELEESRLEKQRLEAEMARLGDDLDGRSRRTNGPDSGRSVPTATKTSTGVLSPKDGSPSLPAPPVTESAGASPIAAPVDSSPSRRQRKRIASLSEELAALNVADDAEFPTAEFMQLLQDREEQIQESLASASRYEEYSSSERAKLHKRIAEVEAQKAKLIKDLTAQCERVAALEQVIGANTQSEEATREVAGKRGKSGVGDLNQLRLLQQRLEQLVAVHRKLLRKYARLELECQETRSKVTLRDERISQLEYHSHQMGTSMRRQAQRHVEEIQKLRSQVALLREEQREQAAQARFLLGGTRGGQTPQKWRTQVRGVRGGHNPNAEQSSHVKMAVRGGGGGGGGASSSSADIGGGSFFGSPLDPASPDRASNDGSTDGDEKRGTFLNRLFANSR